MRLDKWLWAARFHKTRQLAAAELAAGRVQVNEQPAKPSREVRPGDRLILRQPGLPFQREVVVKGLSALRGPAAVAQTLYEETAESQARREHWLAHRPMLADPALAISHGRPTKHDRRQLVEWERWSASADDAG